MIHCHAHTDISNKSLIDCINKYDALIDHAIKIGSEGLAITDHEGLGNHVKSTLYVDKLREKGRLPENFKLILGNEIYLVDSLEEVRDNYEPGVTKFHHFILLAKDYEGFRQLCKLSSMAWENWFVTGNMDRVPTIKSTLQEIVSENPGHLIGSTACLGGELSHLILKWIEAESPEEKTGITQRIYKFIEWGKSVFASDFYLELQPSLTENQIAVNKMLLMLSEQMDVKAIVTTDAHYLKKEDRDIHRAYLQSHEEEREVDEFYASTYLMDETEIHDYLCGYCSDETIQMLFDNTREIGAKVETYSLQSPTQVPSPQDLAPSVCHLFTKEYHKYPYIEKFAYSPYKDDKDYLAWIETGIRTYEKFNLISNEYYHEILDRLNTEMKELWLISEKLNQRAAGYYTLVKEIVDLIWEDGDSLVGVSRGSAGGWLGAYYLGIIQINPLTYKLPHWRHASAERPELADVDLDTEGLKRIQILRALVQKYGRNRVLNIATYGTEGSKAAIQTACRGLGIDNDIARYLSSLIPTSRGKNWSLKDCLYGNTVEGKEPIKDFVNEINLYSGLTETALAIEGLINKRSSHASGIYIFTSNYWNHNAMMKARNGLWTTQFDMTDSDFMGGLKFDLLTIEALDKIRVCIDMLVENGHIKPCKTLRETYKHHLHPTKADIKNSEMWDMVGRGEIIDLFQFDTPVGSQAVKLIKPNNIRELATANSVMRLMSDGKEQPLDVYVKHKLDIDLWYTEMGAFGLTSTEQKIMTKLLLENYGVAVTQEEVMIMSMHPKISNFSLTMANKLRKGISKKDDDVIAAIKKEFIKSGLDAGTRKQFLEYVWNVQIGRQLGYSFSDIHAVGYALIAIQEMNLAYYYPRIYWEAACLTVNAQSADENAENQKSTDYGKVAMAIAHAKKSNIAVTLPDINTSGFGFKVDESNNQILYGLKGINGIGDEVVQCIMENRPYQNLKHFVEVHADTPVGNSHIIRLIKAGCFDTINQKSRSDTLREFSDSLISDRISLTLANVPNLIKFNLISKEIEDSVKVYGFSKYIQQSKFIVKEVMGRYSHGQHKGQSKIIDNHILLDDRASNFFYEMGFEEGHIVRFEDVYPVISLSSISKEIDKRLDELREYINLDSTIQNYNKALKEDNWSKIGKGTLSTWEMDSLCFYYHEHELDHVNLAHYFISDFNTLSVEPIVVGWNYYKSKKFPKYKINRIAGTVLSRDNNKHTVSLLTKEGVVVVKMYSNIFSYYNKQISTTDKDGKKRTLEKSWFTRGNILIITGYRNGNVFRPKTYSELIWSHEILKIDSIKDGEIKLKYDRLKVE